MILGIMFLINSSNLDGAKMIGYLIGALIVGALTGFDKKLRFED